MNSGNSTAEKHKKTHYLLKKVFGLLLLSNICNVLCFILLLLGRYQGFPWADGGEENGSFLFSTVLLFMVIAVVLCITLALFFFYRYLKEERYLNLFLDGNGAEVLSLIKYPFSESTEKLLLEYQKSKPEVIQWEENRRQAQYLALQNQINPHFLYNTLEAIRSEALVSGLDIIADMSETLANFFRYTISDTAEFVTLSDELRNVRDYFRIQQFRFGDRLKLEILIPPEDQLRFYRLPKLILQPIVENGIIHGLESKIDGGVITINAHTTDEKVYVTIEDNGEGMSCDKLIEINKNLGIRAEKRVSDNKPGGIAIYNVNERLQLLYGKQYGLTYYSAMQVGTTAEIVLPKLNSGKPKDEC